MVPVPVPEKSRDSGPGIPGFSRSRSRHRECLACSFGKECVIGENLGKGELGESKDRQGITSTVPINYLWAFCFSCDRVTHLHCKGYCTEGFIRLN